MAWLLTGVAIVAAPLLVLVDLESWTLFSPEAGLALLVLLGLQVASGTALVVLAVKGQWAPAVPCLMLFVVAFCAPRVGSWIKGRMEQRAEDRGEVLAAGIERFKKRTGQYPPTLAHLLPNDLALVPDTGLAVRRKIPFIYERSDANEYVLGRPSIPFFICYRKGLRNWECVE